MTKTPKGIQKIFAPTPLQQGMLFHAIQAPESSEYIQQYSLHGQGRMDARICQKAWEAIVQRHPALRTSFHWEGLEKPYQVIQTQVELPFTHESIAHLNETAQDEHLRDFLAADSRKGFPLSKAPLIRIALHELGKNRFRMTLTLHHIIADGWSIGIVLSEFIAVYEQILQYGAAELPEAPSLKEYADHVAAKPKEESLKWWAEQLENVSPCMPLSELQKKRSVDTAETYAAQTISLSAQETEAVSNSANRVGVTLNTLFLGAWSLVLAQYCGKRKILTGVTVASRPAEVPGIEETFGLLLNILPLHLDCTGDTNIEKWLHSIQDYLAEASEHDHLPLNSIRSLCAKPDEPFLETLAVFENMPMAEADTTHLGFTFNDVSSFEKTSYPLTLVGFPGKKLRLNLQYNKDEFGSPAVAELLAAMRQALLFLTENFYGTLLDYFTLHADSNQTIQGREASYPLLNPWEKLVALAKEKGGDKALIIPGDTERISYRELLRKAQNIAMGLQENNVRAGDLVVLRMDAGLDLVAAMFGVWQLGAAWTPMPTSYPPGQVAKLVQRAKADCILTSPEHRTPVTELIDQKLNINTVYIDQLRSDYAGVDILPVPNLTPEKRACMLHTSGSTGLQKGITLSYRALGNRLHWMWEELPWQPGERACQKTSPAFVDFLWETFGAILQGVPLVLSSPDASRDPQQLLDILEKHKVTRLIVVPSLLNAIHITANDLQGHLPDLKYLTCSGEPLGPELVNKTRKSLPHVQIFNLYGSTEVMGDATWHEVSTDAKDAVPIGQPIANTAAVILDENRIPVPKGKEGELYIAGQNLASGYNHNPEATGKAFICAEFMPFDSPHEIWFATGDRVWLDKDNRIHFAGRADSQCKIRGVRIEPLEIREALMSHPSVLEAVVVTPEHNKQQRIAAYVQTAESDKDIQDSLRKDIHEHLKNNLSKAMQPHAIIFIREWPTTPSGKIHLRALPEAFTQNSVEDGLFQGKLETELAEIWKKTLGQSIPHREANFFELGGDSLSITQLAFNLRKSLKRSVAIKDLYAYPVLKDMAEFIVSVDQGQHSLPEIPQAMEDRTLADDLKPKNFPPPVPALSPGQHVLVTGAPGFIGLWILGTLLKRGDLHIKCMETCESPDEGMASLQNKLKEAGCWKESYSERLSVISAALDKPNLGLQQNQWDNLANETDIIVHSGFHVNLAQSYTVLRPSNVLGTREVLRLACEGSIPMHYIGSTSIVDFVTRAHETNPVQEDDPFATCTGIQTGYILSRWVADHMIRRAGERGLPVAIYRMTTVGGDADSLYCDTDEIYWRLVRVFTQTGLIPQSKRVIDLVPVDEAAMAVVTLASQKDSYGRAFHMNSPRKLPWETIHKYLSNAGYNITMTSSEKWAEHLRNLSPEKVDGNVRILLSMINDDGYDANTSLTMGCDATNMTLKQLNCEINPVSEDLFQGYLDHMVKQGWLEPAQ